MVTIYKPDIFPDKLHSKLLPHGAHLGMSVLSSHTKTDSPPTDRSYLLTSIPHLSQLDTMKVGIHTYMCVCSLW